MAARRWLRSAMGWGRSSAVLFHHHRNAPLGAYVTAISTTAQGFPGSAEGLDRPCVWTVIVLTRGAYVGGHGLNHTGLP